MSEPGRNATPRTLFVSAHAARERAQPPGRPHALAVPGRRAGAGKRRRPTGSGRRVSRAKRPSNQPAPEPTSQGSGSPTARRKHAPRHDASAWRVPLLAGTASAIRPAAAKMEQSVTEGAARSHHALVFCLPGYVPEPVRSNGRARQAPTAGSGARTTPLLCSSSALQQVRFGAPYAGRSATYVDVHGCTWTVA